MNIVYCVDENYAPVFGASLASLVEYNDPKTINLFIMTPGLSELTWAKINHITARYKINTTRIDVGNAFEGATTHSWYSTNVYTRLLIPKMINEDRVLYIDCDTVIRKDLTELYNTNLDGYCIGAIENSWYTGHLGQHISEGAHYFNSGILLIDNVKTRETGMFEKVIELLKTNTKVYLAHVDQCAMNVIFNGDWKKLHPKFNLQTNMVYGGRQGSTTYTDKDLEDAIDDPTIIHFTNDNKPWFKDSTHRFKHLFLDSLNKTPFKRFQNIVR